MTVVDETALDELRTLIPAEDSDRLADTIELDTNVTAPLAETVDTAFSVAELCSTNTAEEDTAPEQLRDASANPTRTQSAVLVAPALALASAVRTRCASDVVDAEQLAALFDF